MKPIDAKYKYGFIVALIILLFALIGFIDKGYKFFELIAPEGKLLNWKFVIVLTFLSSVIVWFIMNHFWRKEYEKHQQTRFELENYIEKLKQSENKRLTDIITGIPNLQSLEYDIENYFKSKKSNRKSQFILIDLKNFRHINNVYGFLKTNELLRAIAQTVYQKMRRNEDMYKYPVNVKGNENYKESFYRIHSGGDEFAFIIEGSQADALGFTNRLVKQFESFSSLTEKILGRKISLSFHCAVVEMDPRDTINDIFRKADDCYRVAKEGKKDFTICWHPNHIERDMRKPWEITIYNETRKLFEVLTMEDKDYNVNG